MILAIAYNHKDCFQALKLLSWVAFLSHQAKWYMRAETLLLIPSRHAASKNVHQEMVDCGERYFAKVAVSVPSTEHEVGWPGAANFMFKEGLQYAESLQEDMFWLEPDAIPLHPHWWPTIKDEYAAAGKTFMGGLSNVQFAHMTGIAVYGKGWRKVAPSLITAPDHAPFDLHASREVLPHAHLSPFIQHQAYDPIISDLNILNPDALIFHQDKKGALIPLLARQYGQNIADIFSQPSTTEPVMSERYFFTENSNRHIRSQGHSFVFDPTDSMAGLWRGVYKTDNESQLIALSALVSNRASAVQEISVEEYERHTKKKVRSSNDSQPLAPTVRQEGTMVQPVARVVDPPPLVPKPILPTSNVVKNLSEVLKVDTVKPSEPIHTSKRASPKPKPRAQSSRR